MSWEVRVPNRVSKQIKKLARGDKERVIAALLDFKEDPWRGDIEVISKLPFLLKSRILGYAVVRPPCRTLAKYGFVVRPRLASKSAISQRKRV